MGWGDWAIVGINSIGSLISLKDGQCMEIVMVHWFQGKIEQKVKYREYANL